MLASAARDLLKHRFGIAVYESHKPSGVPIEHAIRAKHPLRGAMKSPASNVNTLTAVFKRDLSIFPGYLIGEGEHKSISLAAGINGYDVELRLESHEGIGLKRAQDAHGRFIFNSLIARISHGETGINTEEPDANDGRLFSCLFNYQEILVVAANRLVRYFKYRLRNP